MASDEPTWRAFTGGLLSGMSMLVLAIVVAWATQLPVPEQAAALASPGTVIAYRTSGRTPSVLVDDGTRLTYTRLESDWSLLAHGPHIAWTIPVSGYRLPHTDKPASAWPPMCSGDSNAACDGSVDLAGELTDPAIRYVEISVDGVWESHLVWGSGFIVPLGSGHVLGDIRWLDSEFREVWAVDRDLNGRIEATSRPVTLPG
jgi:hypothetical protein